MTHRPTYLGKPFPWTKSQLAKLGKMSDAQYARQLGVCLDTVRKKRIALGKPAWRPANTLNWGPRDIDLLGKLPDKQVARFLGMSQMSVINKRKELGIGCYARGSKAWHRWTKEEIAVLGTMSDADAALKTGINKASIAWKRCKLKIPPFTQKRPKRLLTQWTRKEISVLGKMTDAAAAAALDLAPSAVRLKRLSLGIPPYGRRSS